MRQLKTVEMEQVSGGEFSDNMNGALAIMGLSLAGGPFTMAFGFTIGLGMMGAELYYSYW
jgi:hypothetical protein